MPGPWMAGNAIGSAGYAPDDRGILRRALVSSRDQDIRAGYLLRTTLARLYIALLGLEVWIPCSMTALVCCKAVLVLPSPSSTQ